MSLQPVLAAEDLGDLILGWELICSTVLVSRVLAAILHDGVN